MEEKMEEKTENNKEPKYFKCDKGCCKYTIIPYKQVYYSNNIYDIKTKIKKAGSFIYNQHSNKILLVQSRGQMWGPPKGTLKPDESILTCAIREVKEETGIELDESQLKGSVIIKSKAQYYFTELQDSDEFLTPQSSVEDNDANGIGWFNIDCLNKLISEGKIFINQHCRLLIKKIFDKEISYNT